jgi:RNA polymerase sigma factor for flagellar operon FliA
VDYQRLLLDQLDLVRQIVRTTGRRRHLSPPEQDDFGSFVNLRLVENDYAILRKFQGRSSWWTYLAAVIERLSIDYCTEKWGRWRPSVQAERLGPAAVELERLVARDGHTVEEAIELVRSHHGASVGYDEIRGIADSLPQRVRASEVGEEAAAQISSSLTSDETLLDADRQQDIERLQRALQTAFDAIPAQDRVLIALRFDQDLSIAEISRITGVSVPTLHRRLDKSVKHLRLALSRSGFDPPRVANLIGHPSITLSPLLRSEVERFLGSVRLSKRDD